MGKRIKILIVFFITLSCFSTIAEPALSCDICYIENESSNEKVYPDMFVKLLMPYIDKEVDNYYSKYLKELPSVDPWSVDITNVTKISDDHNAKLLVELKVLPYVGPHLYVGTDNITILIIDGIPKVEKFKHIESFPLPPNYKNIIKEWPILQ